jgi:Ulp1 family protease
LGFAKLAPLITNTRHKFTSTGGNIFGLDKLLIPINIEHLHWLLAVVFMNDAKVQVYDSMPSCAANNGAGDNTHKSFLGSIKDYLNEEHKAKYSTSLPKEWSFHDCPNNNTIVPQQSCVSYDCGVFVCFIMDLLLDDCPLSGLTQEAIATNGRNWIGAAIMSNQLLY